MHVTWATVSQVLRESQQPASCLQVSLPPHAEAQPLLQALTCLAHGFLTCFFALLLDDPADAPCCAAMAATSNVAPRALRDARRCRVSPARRTSVSVAGVVMASPCCRDEPVPPRLEAVAMARHPPACGQQVNPATSCTLWGLRGFTRAAGGWASRETGVAHCGMPGRRELVADARRRLRMMQRSGAGAGRNGSPGSG